VAALCRGPARERDHHRLPGLELSPARRASWHRSQAVRTWIRAHHHQAKREQTGVRIVVCPLLVNSPWLNPLEPHWVHGTRGVVEADGILPAWELAERVCAYFQWAHEPHLVIPEKVA
jgi:hypothetical protein